MQSWTFYGFPSNICLAPLPANIGQQTETSFTAHDDPFLCRVLLLPDADVLSGMVPN